MGSVDFYQQLFNAVDALILVLDFQGKIVFVNQSWVDLTGYSLAEVKGEDFQALFTAVEQKEEAEFQKSFKELSVNSSVKNYETYLLGKHGQRHRISWSSNLFSDIKQNFEFIVFTGEDITELNKLKEDLTELKEQQEILLDSIDIQIWYLKDIRTYGAVNQAFADFLGLEKADLVDSSLREVRQKEEWKLCIPKNRKVFSEKEKVRTQEWVENAQGEKRLLEINKYPKLDKQGEVKYVVCTAQDITKRKEMQRELKQNKRKIELLHKLTSRMGTSQRKEEVYQLTMEAAEDILDFNLCILNIKEGDKLLIKATSSNMSSAYCKDLSIDEGIPGKTYQTGRSYLIKDVFKIKESILTGKKSKYRSTISVPLGKLGVFQVVSEKVAAFDEEDLKLIELLTSHTTAALKRLISEAKIKHMSFHDDLTGLYNRTFLLEEMDRLDQKAELPLSIVLADVNGLKLINGAFGYEVGDRLLIKVARIIEETCLKRDVIARWSGDEFVILLPQSGEQRVQKLCEQIRDRCQQVELEEGINISLSLGYATKESSTEEIDDTFKRAEEGMYKHKLKESKSARSTIIDSLKTTLIEKTYETAEHAQRLKDLALELGKSMDLSDFKLTDLVLLAELHDLGKVGISEKIIQKPGPLTDEEWQEIQRHPEIGYQIAESSAELSAVAEGILCHHEWWDGSGYPQGLKGEEIPLISRVISIVDAFDVMTNKRPYKEAMSKQEALAELKSGAGTQFDPQLVEQFVDLLT
ncbi:HD domain-containing phosphohydrolase [Fuchsiella alkaliacetigena]|uniref:HD domain-containing phosphohydrolase n=1 Tax=Fuchsiella alkaliacetigena TaxID=957042 RepID=UPI00200A455B|nr:HD domain-containing phosphohydrolase [Fuchsiella alkaliacetigena]MCK8825158.1 diguanylate cyclase [Fuchsiella alkaliacetigena]